MIVVIVIMIVTGGKQSQPSLPLCGFGLDLDRSWIGLGWSLTKISGWSFLHGSGGI